MVLGESAARVMVMLLSAAVGQAAGGLAQKLPKLPGAAQASLVMEAQTGVAISSVESVAMTAEGFTLQVAAGSTWKPPSAVASQAGEV